VTGSVGGVVHSITRSVPGGRDEKPALRAKGG
jgi:hypothetical protein